MANFLGGAGIAAVNKGNQTSYKSLGQLLMSLHGADNAIDRRDDEEAVQKRGIFQKQHILNIAHSSMEPQRDYMYMLYIADIPGKFWVEVASNYPSFVKRMVSYAYAISVGTISTAVYLGMIKLFALKGKTGTSSPQQELVYRASSVTMPSRVVKEVEANYIGGVRANHPISIQYDGELSCTFEEDESAFILRQFHSWMDPIDEEIVATNEADLFTYNYKEVGGLTGAINSVLGGDNSQSEALKHKYSLNYHGSDDSYIFDQNSFMDIRTKMKTDIELYMFRYSGDDVGFKVVFYNCYPKVIGQSSWSYGSSGTISYTVSFAYDYFKVVHIPYPVRGKNTNNFRSVWGQTVNKMLQFGVNMLFMYILRIIMSNKTADMLARPQNVPNRDIIQRTKNLKDKVAEKSALALEIANEPDHAKRIELQKKSGANSKISLNMGDDNTNPNEDIIAWSSGKQNITAVLNGVEQGLAVHDAVSKLTDKIHTKFENRKLQKDNFNPNTEISKLHKSSIGTERITPEGAATQISALNEYVEPAKLIRPDYAGLNNGEDNTSLNEDVVDAHEDSLRTIRKGPSEASVQLTDIHGKALYIKDKARAEGLTRSKESRTQMDDITAKATEVREKARGDALKLSDKSRIQMDEATANATAVREKARAESLSKSEDALTITSVEAEEKQIEARSSGLNGGEDNSNPYDIEYVGRPGHNGGDDSYNLDPVAIADFRASKESAGGPGHNKNQDNSNLSEIAIERHDDDSRAPLSNDIHSKVHKLIESIRPGLNGGNDNYNPTEYDVEKREDGHNINISDIKESTRPGLNGGKDNIDLADIELG